MSSSGSSKPCRVRNELPVRVQRVHMRAPRRNQVATTICSRTCQQPGPFALFYQSALPRKAVSTSFNFSLNGENLTIQNLKFPCETNLTVLLPTSNLIRVIQFQPRKDRNTSLLRERMHILFLLVDIASPS